VQWRTFSWELNHKNIQYIMSRFFSSAPMFQDTGLLAIRVVTGLLMAYHGWEVFDAEAMRSYLDWDPFKNPSGATMVYVGKAAELVTGLLLAVGFLTRPAAIGMILAMLYIAFVIGHGKVWYEDQHPFLFVLLALVYVIVGGGPWSVDRKVFGA
jgi:putative oxidoreductase